MGAANACKLISHLCYSLWCIHLKNKISFKFNFLNIILFIYLFLLFFILIIIFFGGSGGDRRYAECSSAAVSIHTS